MEAVLRGADALRAALWRVTARSRLGRACIRERSLRLCVVASAQVALALGLTLCAPLWLLLVGPIVLGVPHAVADVRYLVVQRPGGLPARGVLAIALPLGAMTLVRAALLLGAPPLPEVEVLLGAGAVAAAICVAPAGLLRRSIGLCCAAALGALGLWQARAVALWLGHAHNFVGLGLWLAWARHDGPARHRLAPVALVGAGVALLALGPVPAAAPAAAGLGLDELVATLAPGLAAPLALRLVLVYAFAQAVHYTVWLRLIPGTRAPRPAPASFRRSLASLTADLGRAGTAACVLLALAVPACALVDAYRARAVYLTLVLFHGWLELAVVAFLLAGLSGRRRPARA